MKLLTYDIVRTYTHPLPAFTQGFEYHNGFIVESLGGLNGSSTLRKFNLDTGEITQNVSLEREYFAEGCTQLKDKIYQLTWKHNIGFIYDLDFNVIGQFSYKGEGWGLTNDGTSLIMSNGTGRIQYLNPETFAIERTIKVNLSNVNGLAYIDGIIYANIWQTAFIVCIDPIVGRIINYLDFTNVYTNTGENVLNGIAYDSVNKRVFVTGKNWPLIYEITIVHPTPSACVLF
jgi:glutamine cyclotransferase